MVLAADIGNPTVNRRTIPGWQAAAHTPLSTSPKVSRVVACGSTSGGRSRTSSATKISSTSTPAVNSP